MITIKGEIYSSKNHRQIFMNRKTGKMFIAKPKKAKDAEGGIQLQLQAQRKDWLKMRDGQLFPLYVCFDIVRQTRRRFDYVNIVQSLLDQMVKAEYLPDDSVDYVIPVFVPYRVNKENPQTIITILQKESICFHS